MSTPTNPLSKFSTYQIRHILAAFRYTEDAETVNLTKTSGNVGDPVKGGVIIVNEFTDDKFMMPSVIWEWNKSGPTGNSTTSMDGMLDIADRSGGQFIDWFRSNVVSTLGVSAQQMTFSLKTYFMGTDRILGNDKYVVVTGNQLLFSVHNFNEVMNSDEDGTRVNLTFTSLYNTSAQSPTLSKPYQITLTHKDGNLNNVDPEIKAPTSGIMPRSVEDGIKKDARVERLDKSKPMKNLKDAFDAFEFDLNQQQSVHKRQVQTWLDNIRDNYEYKIDPPPKQKRGDKLPIQFHVELDPIYHGYELDNRNLPFEQVVEDPTESGVTSIPFRAGATIVEMVETIMKYSRSVGEDAAKPPLDKSFKVNLSYMRKRDNKIHIFLKVKQITLPFNSVGSDSGPGDGALQPLEFTFKSGNFDDFDITFIKTSISSDAGIIPLEAGPRKAVFGNREPVMGERIPATAPGTDYFKSEYSGLRLPIVPYLNSGLEDSVAGSRVDLSTLVSNSQTSDHEMQIWGNSTLMYDLHRLPSEASTIGNPGSAQYYMMPETQPMYLKIKIYMSPGVVKRLEDPAGMPELYYYKNHYEIIGVINSMVDGAFYQHIQLMKTDDIV